MSVCRAARRGLIALLVVAAAVAMAPATSANDGAGDDTSRSRARLYLTITPLGFGFDEWQFVTLTCGPDGGTHPNPGEACDSLRAVDGELGDLPNTGDPCPMDFDPVMARVYGYWGDEPVVYAKVFSNDCVAAASTDDVFAF